MCKCPCGKSPCRIHACLQANCKANDPIRVYDTSGSWGDPKFHGDCTKGLPKLREGWILERDDVESYEGRRVKPQDDGYLSEAHKAAAALKNDQRQLVEFESDSPRVYRAKAGRGVSQLHYAREGIITPEMEYIAIRENMKLQSYREGLEMSESAERNSLNIQHPGQILGRGHPGGNYPRVCPLRGGAGARYYPGQCQSSRAGAHDHRAEFPGEDQHQHRKLRRRVLD